MIPTTTEYIRISIPNQKQYILCAITHNQLEIVKYLYNVCDDDNQKYLDTAILHNKQEIFKYLYNIVRPYDITDECMKSAILYNKLEIVKYLYSVENDKQEYLNYAIMNNQLEIFEYLYNITRPYDITDKCVNYAVAHDRKFVLEYLSKAHNIQFDNTLAAAAVDYGHLNIIEYLYTDHNIVCSPWSLNTAAINGHLDILKYMKKVKCINICDKDILNYVDNIDVIKFIHEEYGHTIHPKHIIQAINNKRYDIVVYLCESMNQ